MIDRIGNNDPVAGSGERHDGGRHALHDIKHHTAACRRRLPTLPCADPGNTRLDHAPVVPPVYVTPITVGQERLQRLVDQRIRREIHIGNPGRDDIAFVEAPLLACPLAKFPQRRFHHFESVLAAPGPAAHRRGPGGSAIPITYAIEPPDL